MSGGPTLVAGATGRQGGAVARHLLAAGARVRAMTRRPSSPAAQRLAATGAELVQADLDDPSSLARAADGAHAVFSVQDFWQAGAAGEVRQGTALARAAAEAGVALVVQSTMATPRDAPGAPHVAHFESKRTVERALADLGLPHALVGTVYFMDNVLDADQGGRWTIPTLAGSLAPHTELDVVAVDDVGAVAAAMLLDPGRFVGARADVVGDRLTVAAMRAAYRRASGRRARRWRLPAWALRRLNAEFAEQLAWQNAAGFAPDAELTRELRPELVTFEAFVRAHGVTNL